MARGAVLLVEDDFLVQEVMQVTLEDAGYEVATAGGGAEALAVLQERSGDFGALVTDVNLGGAVDGWAVGQMARRLAPRIGVVYASGDSEHVWRTHGAPGSVMLPKPFEPHDLIAAVEKACAASQRD